MPILKEQILSQTNFYKQNLHNKKYRVEPLQETIRDRIELVKDNNLSTLVIDAYSLLHTLDWALSQPELVNPELLAAYVTELARLMENAGAGIEFRMAVDKAIDLYSAEEKSTVDLYLAKVEYLRLTDTGSQEKEKALRAAAQAAKSPEDSTKVMLKLAQYYIDSSQYKLAIQTCIECEKLISENTNLHYYSPKVSDLLGITFYYLFDYETAKSHLHRACELGYKHNDHHTIGEALHYLGRVAMDQGDPLQAMNNFIAGWQHQPDNLADSAWYHLRMGNLLVAVNLIKQASDHFRQAQDVFLRIEYDGSALVQVELGWADIYKAEKEYRLAEQHYFKAIEFAQRTQFTRGGLLCLVKLFWLQLIRLRRLDKALRTFFLAMVNREIRQNIGAKLVLKYLWQVVLVPYKRLTGSSHSVMGVSAKFSTTIDSCRCPIHANPNESQ